MPSLTSMAGKPKAPAKVRSSGQGAEKNGWVCSLMTVVSDSADGSTALDWPVRDINGLKELENFTSFVRFYDPSHHFSNLSAGDKLNSTMIGINIPIRIGHSTVMPGDVVLGRDGGVMFIPPQLAENVATYSEITQLRDHFGHQRLREGKYTAGQIDARWSDPIESDFTQWLRDNVDKLPVAREQVEAIIKTRSKQ